MNTIINEQIIKLSTSLNKEEQIIALLDYNVILNEDLIELIVTNLVNKDINNNPLYVEHLLKSNSLNANNTLLVQIIKALHNEQDENIVLFYIKESLKILNNCNKTIRIDYVNAYLMFSSIYENLILEKKYTKQFYEQLLLIIKEEFNENISVILMNINEVIMQELNQFNELLKGLPPTKTIKDLRLVEYVQFLKQSVDNILNDKLEIDEKFINETSFMLKVIKGNKKVLIDFDKEDYFKEENYTLNLLNDSKYRAIRNFYNPENVDKTIIRDKNSFEQTIEVLKNIKEQSNKINHIKIKIRHKKKGNK